MFKQFEYKDGYIFDQIRGIKYNCDDEVDMEILCKEISVLLAKDRWKLKFIKEVLK